MAEEDRSQTVLIVDDDDGWARLISDEVGDAGFRPDRVKTVEEAQKRFEQGNDISLVVLDILFGDALEPRGIDLALWIKQSKQWRNVPIVFCTVVSGAEIRARLKDFNVGNELIFEKPFDFSEFSDRIKTILR